MSAVPSEWFCPSCFAVRMGFEPDMGDGVAFHPGRCAACGTDAGVVFEVDTPTHRRPSSCYVCGSGVPYRETASRPDCWHNFTNAEADTEAVAHDRQVVARSPEAAYVAQHRPY